MLLACLLWWSASTGYEIDMDCRCWRHLQLYQHAIICYGIWLHDRQWWRDILPMLEVLLPKYLCMMPRVWIKSSLRWRTILEYNLLQRIIVFVEQWLHVPSSWYMYTRLYYKKTSLCNIGLSLCSIRVEMVIVQPHEIKIDLSRWHTSYIYHYKIVHLVNSHSSRQVYIVLRAPSRDWFTRWVLEDCYFHILGF